MKKFIVLAACLIVAAACSTEPPATNAPATNANSATTAKSATPTEAEAMDREKGTWDAIKKKDYDGFGNMITTDYLEVGGDGIFNKEEIIADLKNLTLNDYTISNSKMMVIDKDAFLLTYDVTIKGVYKNEAFPEGPYHAGSAWVNRDGKWQA